MTSVADFGFCNSGVTDDRWWWLNKVARWFYSWKTYKSWIEGCRRGTREGGGWRTVTDMSSHMPYTEKSRSEKQKKKGKTLCNTWHMSLRQINGFFFRSREGAGLGVRGREWERGGPRKCFKLQETVKMNTVFYWSATGRRGWGVAPHLLYLLQWNSGGSREEKARPRQYFSPLPCPSPPPNPKLV